MIAHCSILASCVALLIRKHKTSGFFAIRQHISNSYSHLGFNHDVTLYAQGAMAATYSALKNSQPTPELKPIESSFLAQRRVKKLPSTSL